MFIGHTKLPTRGLRLPGGGPQIDWTNPITAGLVGCWVVVGEGGSVPVIRDLVGGHKLIAVGTATAVVPGPRGMEAQSGVQGQGWQALATSEQMLPTNAVSMLWMGRLMGASTNNFGPFIGCSTNNTSAAPNYAWGMTHPAALTVRIAFNNSTTLISAVFANTAGEAHGLLGSILFGGTLQLWRDGRLFSSSAQGAGSFSYTATSTMAIGADPGSSQSTSNNAAGTSVAAAWNRQLTPGESALISADPTNFLAFPGDLVWGLLGGALLRSPFLVNW